MWMQVRPSEYKYSILIMTTSAMKVLFIPTENKTHLNQPLTSAMLRACQSYGKNEISFKMEQEGIFSKDHD